VIQRMEEGLRRLGTKIEHSLTTETVSKLELALQQKLTGNPSFDTVSTVIVAYGEGSRF